MARKRKSKRPSWDKYFLQIAELVATRATCPRLHVGAVLVKDRKIISTGYNGAPRKTDQCDEVGCYLVNNHCARALHAEENAVIAAAYHGVSTNDATLYVRYFPCDRCAKVIINAGVNRVVYEQDYKNSDQSFTREMFKQAGVKLERIADEGK